MSERYWLVHPNGGRQLIDPRDFDIVHLAEQVRRLGGSLVIESDDPGPASPDAAGIRVLADEGPPVSAALAAPPSFEPPISALGPLFRARLGRIFPCVEAYDLDINTRPTVRVLGGYYRRRRLIRIYTHDRQTGRRPLEELFDTFLHEVAHHLEYTEPQSFNARASGRVRGRMHSRLFWRILGELKGRWARLQRPHEEEGPADLV